MRRRSLWLAAVLGLSACGTSTTAETTTVPSTATSAPPTTTAEASATTTTSTLASSGERDVRIPVSETRDFELEGTLMVPEGDGPFDAAVIVHGSGPIDRDGTVPGQLNQVFPEPVSVYRDLAEGLAERGIATLRYDKRTCGPFNGCAANGYPTPPNDITIDPFIADAAEAAVWLETQPEIDRVFVIGHSQGSEMVPHLLFFYPTLAGGVLLGAPYGPIDDLLVRQADFSRTFAEDLGLPAAQIDAAVTPLEDLASAVTGLRTSLESGFVGGAPADFWRSWMDLTAAKQKLVATVTAPMIVIGGSNDFNVPTAELDRWIDALAGTRHQTVLIDCVTHALNCVRDDPATIPQPVDVGTGVDERIIDRIADFIASS